MSEALFAFQHALEPARDSAADFQAMVQGILVYEGLNCNLPQVQVKKIIGDTIYKLKRYWKDAKEVMPQDLIDGLTDILAESVANNSLVADFKKLNLTKFDFAGMVKMWLNEKAFNTSTGKKELNHPIEILILSAIDASISGGKLRNDGRTGEIDHHRYVFMRSRHPIAIVHDIGEDTQDLTDKTQIWQKKDLAACCVPAKHLETFDAITRRSYGIPDEKTYAQLTKFGVIKGRPIKEPALDYHVRLSADKDARKIKNPDFDHNLMTDPQEKRILHLIGKAYELACTTNIIACQSSMKTFMERHVFFVSNAHDATIAPVVLEVIKRVRKEDPDEIARILKKESSEYKGGLAEAVVNIYKRKNGMGRVLSIVGDLTSSAARSVAL